MGTEFKRWFPIILFPFGDKKNLPWIKVVHRDDHVIEICNARSSVKIKPDDSIRYTVEDGRLLVKNGPSFYNKEFHKLVANSTVDIACLRVNIEGSTSYNHFDNEAKIIGDEIVHDERRGIIEKFDVAIIISKNGRKSIREILVSHNAELKQENIEFVKQALKRFQRTPSGAFKYYEQLAAKQPAAGLNIETAVVPQKNYRVIKRETPNSIFAA